MPAKSSPIDFVVSSIQKSSSEIFSPTIAKRTCMSLAEGVSDRIQGRQHEVFVKKDRIDLWIQASKQQNDLIPYAILIMLIQHFKSTRALNRNGRPQDIVGHYRCREEQRPADGSLGERHELLSTQWWICCSGGLSVGLFNPANMTSLKPHVVNRRSSRMEWSMVWKATVKSSTDRIAILPFTQISINLLKLV